MFKSIQEFSGRDPAPEKPLEEIFPLSQRAFVLMIRNREKRLLKEAFLNIAGAIEMLAGLEYHHDNIVRISAELARGVDIDETSIFHEAVAYVNRLGQLYYFAKSSLAARAFGDGLARIPTICKYMVFRNKHAAHRSIDMPRKESDDTQLLQAMSLSRTWGKMMKLKPGAPELRWPRYLKAGSPESLRFHREEWANRYITFQLYDEDQELHVNLTIEQEHDNISREAYELLRNAILWEPRP